MLASGQTIVIKIGTSSLVRIEKKSINISALSLLCETVRNLKEQGHKVVLVSSGAVGVGCQRLGLAARPKELAKRQALAAAGQVHLMRYYDDFFSAIGLTCAQVMLTLDNLANLSQYTNTRSTFEELFAYDIVPVVNENDTVAVEELHFGDNDTLSAKVATAVQADWLFLLTDVDALYTSNPVGNPEAQPIREVHDIAQLHADTGTDGTEWGTGGMSTKLTAARIATAAGCSTVICKASQPENIEKILLGAPFGTVFHPHPKALKGRKRWILMVPTKGQLWMDEGAMRAVQQRAKSLFSAGIVKIIGKFGAQDSVQLCDAEGTPFANGLCNYAHTDVIKLKGKKSQDIIGVLGFCGSEEIVHRDNISLLSLRNPPSDASTPAPPYALLEDAATSSSSTADAIQDPRATAGDLAVTTGATVASTADGGAMAAPEANGHGIDSRAPSMLDTATDLDTGTEDEGDAYGNHERAGPEEVGALSPRSDSVTSLTRQQVTGEEGMSPTAAAVASGMAAGLARAGSNTTLPPRSPLQQRGLQRASSDDRPNPLPSPASGFRGRTLSPQKSSVSQSTDGDSTGPAMLGAVPIMTLPDKATGAPVSPGQLSSNRASGADTPLPPELHAVLDPDVASAAVMSSQGPIREATEADIAVRRAIIAAAKSGRSMEASPTDSHPPLSSPTNLPPVNTSATSAAHSPASVAAGASQAGTAQQKPITREQEGRWSAGQVTAPPAAGAHQGTASQVQENEVQRSSPNPPAPNPASAANDVAAPQLMPHPQAQTAGAREGEGGTKPAANTNVPATSATLLASNMRQKALGAAESAARGSQSTEQPVPQNPRPNPAASPRNAPVAGASLAVNAKGRPVEGPPENFRPLSTAAGISPSMQRTGSTRSMFTPMRNHDHARRSVDGGSPTMSRQTSGSLLPRQPSSTPPNSSWQPSLGPPPAPVITRQPSGGLSPRGQSHPSPAGAGAALRPALRRGNSNGGTIPACDAGNTAIAEYAVSPKEVLRGPQDYRQSDDVQARLDILRQREAAMPSSASQKRVSFQADS